jgi:Family of unknown function (DUF5992)
MMKSRFLVALVAASCAMAGSAVAGDLALNARVVRVANTGNNSTVFSVAVSGGSLNLCSGWITFPVSAAPDADTHKRAYAAALLALSSGMLVRVHNYSSDSCEGASYIDLVSP